jgi:hypothetical protein
MPFDAVGFPSGHDAKAPDTPKWLPRSLWRSLLGRLRDVSDHHQHGATVAVLRDARAMISDEAQWVQGIYERDGRRCAMGALQAAGRGYWRAVRRDAAGALEQVARLNGHHSVESMNDSVSHTEVLAMFDAAILRAGLGIGRLA